VVAVREEVVTAIEELAAQADKTRRDRWGRYLVVPPKGGKPVGYTRVSTIAKTLDDGSALGPWKATACMVGALRRPGNMASWQALVAEHADPWYGSDQSKAECKRLVEVCMEAGGSTDRASIGTALHKLCELHDLGRTPTISDPSLAADLAAYDAAIKAAGLTFDPDGIERTIVLDDHQVAGTVDRHAVKVPGRRLPVIADLKTGASLDFSGGSIAVQLAAYANASAGYVQGARANGADDARIALPAVDLEVALVIHLPAGEARCVLQWIDIAKGWEAFQQAMAVREWRKDSRRLFTPFAPSAPPDLPAGEDALPSSAAPALAPSAEPPAGSPITYNEGDRVSYLGVEYRVGVDNGSSVHLPDLPDHLAQRSTHSKAGQRGYPPLYERWVFKSKVTLVSRRPEPEAPTPSAVLRRPIDEGDKVDEITMGVLRVAYANCDPDHRKWIGALWNDATGNADFHLKGHPTVRRFELVRALVAHTDHDEEYLRHIIAHVVGQDYALFPTIPLGMAVGSMSVDEAKRFAEMVTGPTIGLIATGPGTWRLAIDAAA
jgi:hypothetical protein